jgi:sulfur carrier protein
MIMKIILNTREETFEGETTLTVSEILARKNFTFKMLVVKLNENLISKESYESTQVQAGDKLTVLHLISGG